MKPLKNAFIVVACASLLFGHSACQTTTNLLSSTQFSESAYNRNKKIKADSLALIARAKDRAPYTSIAADVDQLMRKIDQAISSEQGRTKNVPTVEQWKRVRTQMSHLFDLWKTKGTLSPAFVVDEKRQTSDLFDIIIRTEDAKRPRS
jgi:hypothetical protein